MELVICDMSVSLDGYVTGPNDSRENPFVGQGTTSGDDTRPVVLQMGVTRTDRPDSRIAAAT